ncbi:bifunctional D-glycero-beta-D-manno-heptose-7-phosphate kinase/D-glycero-beta-D-manno-heptose 1-phosphate adenylyltransferase HldE [Candidatus Venteria ishoeyi]|uniref:bifunctional D-glycero-beta-D-manno-heptose-7-phosphate kinase/D-glycero-beta-D-manno-heptose 1-phosphate adenylyltransferase HldE n=1 Tax=Candidatus Venteria ishoeyi TaxID=1899563 RepID=UPI0025A57758|nr:bifunctional D-glycero-beta-D-manno-heptose-7-phosphate kinase/D-glycero-beta-D-manno-heptose 1-phosphate adenylyltransferase HldE [Candidatus Venteria ishoeyi]MDM8545151.1 bifunctional D-glycero-beta-D-manno-heptose-7-phosphate kinase/D-glycero-beta-D-manno-heptose 1-phosphate adenylyltransferase HldE [Candidatus Venteria ishoeyi]
MYLPIPDFKRARVLVLGDVMLDRYWHGSTSRISPEAPVPVVRVQQQQERPGGAANVALNIRALNANAQLMGVTGDDSIADMLEQQLREQGVDCFFQRHADVPTITKLRILSRHQQLIRVDFEEAFASLDIPALQTQLADILPQVQVVVLSDYAKGALSDPGEYIAMARAAGRPVLVDPKGQDFRRYRGATLITPNLTEFEAVVGTCPDENTLVERGEQLRKDLELAALLITRSEHGMTLLQKNHAPLHLPAQAREVYDVTGAGDTVIGVLAASLAAGEDLASATALANLAASLVVAKLGAETITPAELETAQHMPHEHGIYAAEMLKPLVLQAQEQGQKVVMTNGCFDLLHAGHVQYLSQARQLGDRLIVAVNDDDSVRRLKGDKRPINPLAQRMAVLNGLESVDWVVPFGEDTPEQLICDLLPDVLVKGGDYQVHEIAGHQCVQAQGGEVRILDFLAGCSSSAMIHKMTD